MPTAKTKPGELCARGRVASTSARMSSLVPKVSVRQSTLLLTMTWVYLSMRTVMDIGGSCGSGGPYVVANPCPDNVVVFMTLGMNALAIWLRKPQR